MTPEIILALLLLGGAVAAFATGALRLDLTALLLMVLVAVLGLSSPQRALSGFANPAVLTVAGMFVISAGLSRTGVAALAGDYILRVAGSREFPLMMAITLFSGAISGFMNNIGVVAMMLPVVMDISRRTNVAPSKLLIPMAMGAQLGGFTTLVGTSANLLAADALREAGLEPFGLFTFTPIGLTVLVGGIGLIALASTRVLPERTPGHRAGVVERPGLREGMELEERFFRLTLPANSLLDGRTLAESLIGSALGIHVLAVERGRKRRLAPGPDLVLRGGDRLLVQGRPDFFMELRGGRHVTPDGGVVHPDWLESEEVGLAAVRVTGDSPLVGRTVNETEFRSKEGLLVLTMRREGFRRRTHLQDTPMEVGDELLLQGPRERLVRLRDDPEFREVRGLSARDAVKAFDLEDRLWGLQVTDDSLLAGRRLAETRLGDAIGFVVLAIGREDDPILLPGPDTELQPGDHLLVKARPQDLAVLRGLQRLHIDVDPEVHPEELDTEEAGFLDVVLAPRSSLFGKTLRQVNFRERFGLHVVAIVREGETTRANLRDEVLRFGDALLLYGARRRVGALAREPDFILLEEPGDEPPRVKLAPLSLLILAASLLPVIAGWLAVEVAVLGGAALMVVTRCLTPEEAYRAVDWPTIVLVAGMLALGAALSDTGAGALLGEGMLRATAGVGPYALLGLLALVTTLGAQIMPGPAIVVLMAPIAISGAAQMGISAAGPVMAVAIAATSIASPVSQPAQALVMAPAGYRLRDYLRLGLPMTLLVLVLVVAVVPIFFPF